MSTLNIKMKVILVDQTNTGLLYVGKENNRLSSVIANILKNGLVDVRLFAIGDQNPVHNLSNNDLYKDKKHYSISTKSFLSNEFFSPLKESLQNEIYLKRRELIELRMPIVERLAFLSSQALHFVYQLPHFIDVENDLYHAIKESDPELEDWHYGIKEYAHTNQLEPKHAYREIKLEIETIRHIKIKIYSLIKHFSDKINLSNNKEELEAISNEIFNKFIKDNYI
jgi:hypothetical protein